MHYINVPVVNMFENLDERQVASQACFAENVLVEQLCENWVLIRTSDQYTGWIPSQALITRNTPYETSITTSRLSAHIYATQDIVLAPLLTLPFGSKLQVLNSNHPQWIEIALPDERRAFIQKGDVCLEQTKDLVILSQKFLNLPYTWGGRSSFGYDCSGFVQMLYRQIGISLPRDSKDQAKDPRWQTVHIDAIQPQDLIFFGKSDNAISHVGMYLSAGQFIHATGQENQPWLRISHLSDFEWSGDENAKKPYRLVRRFLAAFNPANAKRPEAGCFVSLPIQK